VTDYRLIQKPLANRLRITSEKIILLNQSAFIPSRLISDNIFVAFKTTHFIKNATTASKGKMTDLKLDMSKAYDRTERGYLRVGMQKMGFEKIHLNFSLG
jgi:hypothetical protein